jgi:L-amino acid N-acyltransferase YncA
MQRALITGAQAEVGAPWAFSHMHFIPCTEAQHAKAMLAIFNHEIAHSTSLYEYEPRTLESMRTWFDSKAVGAWPVIGAVDEQGELLGFASYGPFRSYPAFKYTVEHSVYVHPHHHRQGIGHQLMLRLIDTAQRDQVHVMVGAIDSGNQASLALHQRLGFEPAGQLREAGYKFGRWLDLVFYQRILATPARPVEE